MEREVDDLLKLHELNGLYKQVDREKKLESAYYGPLEHPSTLGPLHVISKYVPPVEVAREYLHRQPAYVRHRPAVRRAVRRNRMLAKGIGTDYQADLADVQRISRYNKGVRFLLCVIDILSKKVQVEPLKDKTGIEVRDAFQRMLEKDPLLADSHLATDMGKEFLNEHVREWCNRNQIKHYTLQGDNKAAVVERFQRTLKERLHRLMTARGTYKYIDGLQSVVQSYNSSWHSTIRMRPSEVTKERDEKRLYDRQFKINPKKQLTRGPSNDLKVGDTVLISVSKGVFEKGYTGYWRAQEPFFITEIKQGVPNKQYLLKDKNNEKIQGAFYREQLLKVAPQQQPQQ